MSTFLPAFYFDRGAISTKNKKWKQISWNVIDNIEHNILQFVDDTTCVLKDRDSVGGTYPYNR